LKKIHGITKANPHGLSLPSQSQIRIAFQNTIPKIVFNEDLFKSFLLRWMIQNNISFQQVEKSEFRYLLHYLLACSSSTTAICNSLPESGNTIRRWIINLFESSKLFIKNNLIPSNRIIYFSFDL